MNVAISIEMDDFREQLARRFGSHLRLDEPLSQHTSFRIGGPADFWIELESVAELSELLSVASGAGERVSFLGSGTNILVSDRGVRGVVARLGHGFHFVDWTILGPEADVYAGAAVPFKKLVTDAVERGFEGLEFGEGIPGSLGGGLTMNAGAFGGELGRVVEILEGVTGAGEPHAFSKEELPFSYRRLDLPAGFVITAVRLRLARGSREELRRRVASARERRKSRQPLGLPNAGSIFKNPAGTFAGKLLEDAGVKGLAVGGARVSPQHANFIVNEGNATATDVRALIEEMRRRVREHSGIELETEVKLVGEW